MRSFPSEGLAAEEGRQEELRELLLRSREILERIEQRFFAAHSLAIGEEPPPPSSSPFSEA